MNLLKALGITALMLLSMLLVSALVNDRQVAALFAGGLVVGSSIWACLDSGKLDQFQTGLPGPIVLFAGLIILWIVYFPNYLTKRFAVMAGDTPMKKRYRTGVTDRSTGASAQ